MCKMKLWVTVLIVCLVAVVIAALAIRAAVLKSRRTRTERRLLSQPCDSDSDGTIFVSIVNDTCSRDHGAASVLSLFKEAKCPLRLRVVVYDIIDGATIATPAPLLDGLRASGRAVGFPMDKLMHLVRVLQVPLKLYRGPLAAREQLERFTYKDEAYIMTLQAGAVVCAGWDTLCVQSMQCIMQATSRTAYLTTRLEIVGDAYPKADPATPGTYTAFTPDSARAKQVVAFKLCRIKKSSQVPATVPAPFPVPVPASAWSASFSFTTGSRSAAFKVPVLPDVVEDAVMWGVLVSNAWTAWFHLQGTVAVVPAAAAAASAEVAAASKLSVPLLSAAVLKTLGLNLATLAPTTRARVGLTAHPTVDEIEIKLGSMDEYASLVSRVELTNI